MTQRKERHRKKNLERNGVLATLRLALFTFHRVQGSPLPRKRESRGGFHVQFSGSFSTRRRVRKAEPIAANFRSRARRNSCGFSLTRRSRCRASAAPIR